MAEKPVITVVVPYKNRESYLPETLRSLEEQTFRPLQLILVDNESDDQSVAVCQAFASKHAQDADFEVVLASEPKPGAAAARNRGLALCTTEYVYFFDSDDCFDAHFLESVVPRLTDKLDLLAVPTRMVYRCQEQTRAFIPSDAPEVQVLCSHLSTQSMVFRTDFLRSVGGWNEAARVWDDWELGFRTLLARPRMEWVTDKAFHRILVHDDSITGPSFTARGAEILATLSLAVRQASDRSVLRALYLRHCILLGHFKYEKDRRIARMCEVQMKGSFPSVAACDRWMGRLLSLYVARGGRGAWRIALAWIRWRKRKSN